MGRDRDRGRCTSHPKRQRRDVASGEPTPDQSTALGARPSRCQAAARHLHPPPVPLKAKQQRDHKEFGMGGASRRRNGCSESRPSPGEAGSKRRRGGLLP